MSYDVTKVFTAEEINLIELSTLTLAELKDFWARFSDQDLETAIGGAIMERENLKKGEVTPLKSDLQDTVPEETAKGKELNGSPVGSGLSDAEKAPE